ncbi:hypothetical protein BZG36_02530 [Bifiguratus adelaidae]|uniref:Sodium/calcium exchanger membrane region domain-containing protein n=1 Tax=Bifiguratus adelaidae TaxID=1938954 RepID=A0A261Y286_9FUNG|nr:hypothetical protein BZG36_02530 [Bifiguratus adelaidae]
MDQLAGKECSLVNDIEPENRCAFAKQNCISPGLINYAELWFCKVHGAGLGAKIGSLTLLLLWLLFLFAYISVVASDFFCPNLQTISELLNLSENVAGVTFLALGNGSPDLFSTISAMSSTSPALALGELLGAAHFITTVVAGVMVIIHPFKVPRCQFLRDVIVFSFSILLVVMTLRDKRLGGWEGGMLVAMYLIYVIWVAAGDTDFNRWIPFWKRGHPVALETEQGTEGQPLISEGAASYDATNQQLLQSSNMKARSVGPIERDQEIDGHDIPQPGFETVPRRSSSFEGERHQSQDEVQTFGHRFRSSLHNIEEGLGFPWHANGQSDTDEEGNPDWSPVTPKAGIRPSLLGAIEFNDLMRLRRHQNSISTTSPLNLRRSEDSIRHRHHSKSQTNQSHHRPTPEDPSPLTRQTENASVDNAQFGPSQTPRQCTSMIPEIQLSHHQSLSDLRIDIPSTRISSRPNYLDPSIRRHSVVIAFRSAGRVKPHATYSRTTSGASSIRSSHSSVAELSIAKDQGQLVTPSTIPPDSMDESPQSSSETEPTRPSLPEAPLGDSKPYDPPSFWEQCHRTLFPTLFAWEDKSMTGKFVAIASVPILFMLILTVPVVDDDEGIDELIICEDENGEVTDFVGPASAHNDAKLPLENMEAEEQEEPGSGWNPWLLGCQVVAVPFLVSWSLFAYDLIPGYSNFICALVTIPCSGLYFLSSYYKKASRREYQRPKWFKAFCFVGFVAGVIWILLIANEVVGILQAAGIILRISEAILGLTIFALGNSLGDLVANVTVARMGYPNMALSACFGGPMLNILLGIGASTIYLELWLRKPLMVPLSPNLLVTSAGILITMMSSAVFVWMNGFRISRGLGFFWIVLYLCTTITNLVLEIRGIGDIEY